MKLRSKYRKPKKRTSFNIFRVVQAPYILSDFAMAEGGISVSPVQSLENIARYDRYVEASV